ncbi:MarR family winged helix-turn-helix transcriptional regulator [Polaromonas sp. YR568]|uniref:MarR family winged helix-turn-helix transcriptional regulator n=1 Tax=Polaromonas sp. YR568 TaxID=1855301 RepID=UPI00398BF050
MSNDTQNIIRHWREAVPNDRLAHLIRDASRAFHRALQVRLAQHGVPFGHWTFLRILWECDGLTQKELSERAGVMEPTTFTAMKAMESLGYIERKQIPTNKKNMYVHLTDEGRALKKLLVPLAEETNNVSIEGIAPEHIKLTRTVLLAMIENLARDELQQEKATPARRKAAAANVGAKHAAKEKAEKSATPDKQKPGRPSAQK